MTTIILCILVMTTIILCILCILVMTTIILFIIVMTTIILCILCIRLEAVSFESGKIFKSYRIFTPIIVSTMSVMHCFTPSAILWASPASATQQLLWNETSHFTLHTSHFTHLIADVATSFRCRYLFAQPPSKPFDEAVSIYTVLCLQVS
jgi:hypothetical protein